MLRWLKRLRTRNEMTVSPAPVSSAHGPANGDVHAAGVAPSPTSTSLTDTPAPLSSPAPTPPHIPHEKIVARAYEIWVRKGKPHGQDLKNWMEAEAELRAEYTAHSGSDALPRKSR
jgi:hypothetical protein